MSRNNKSLGLGRSFGSLIPQGLDTAKLINQGERIQNLLISQIHPNPDQPRTEFDETVLTELSESIKRHGIIQPIIVSPAEHDNYVIIAGERRWRAARLAGLERLPAIVRTAAALEQLELALIENVQRVDLSPLEQAISIERLHQQFNMTYVDIARRLGKAPTTINNIVRLLQLPEKAREFLRIKKITEGHARAILALKNYPGRQKELLDKIVSKGWSVRQAEQYVIASKKPSDRPGKAVTVHMAKTSPATRRLAKKLGTDVTLRRTAKGGKIEIIFKDDEELDRLTSVLNSD